MTEIHSIITLDWDAITINEAKRRISYIKETQFARSIEIKMSPVNGYHIYVYLFTPVDSDESHLLRKWWKDDPRRLMMDVFWRHNSNKDNSNVMFTQKRKFNMIWSEIPLFYYTRMDINSPWNIVNQQEQSKMLLQNKRKLK